MKTRKAQRHKKGDFWHQSEGAGISKKETRNKLCNQMTASVLVILNFNLRLIRKVAHNKKIRAAIENWKTEPVSDSLYSRLPLYPYYRKNPGRFSVFFSGIGTRSLLSEDPTRRNQ